MSAITRNGKTYSNADVQIAMLGSIDYEITKLSYSVSQDHKANYSLGSSAPTSYSVGNKTYEASMTMRLKSLSQIEKAAGGDILSIKPFPIVVTYVDDENEIIIDKLLVKFKKTGKTAGDNDEVEADMELFCLDIEFDV